MKRINTIKTFKKVAAIYRKKNKTIGFVPTMGALHAGHISLIRRARRENDLVVVSIFVNPTQFGPNEDLRKYPRQLKQDLGICARESVDIAFTPSAGEIYNNQPKTTVFVSGLSDILCGKFRPNHFRGVTTIVAKLFNIIAPNNAYFGQKDAQQAVIIKKMVSDLNMPVRIFTCPIIRESDGLAMSSRNVYLSKKERADASILNKSLLMAAHLIRNGATNADRLIDRIKLNIEKKNSAKIDYIAIVDPENLTPIKKISKRCLILLAVWIGKTRLIDNIIVNHA